MVIEEKKLIEITDIEPINKGSLLAKCSVHIVPWRLTFHDVKIFAKGQNRWVSMPAREFINSANETKYIEQVTFDMDSVKRRFGNQVLEAFDAFLAVNPDMTPEPLITDSEVPF